MKNRVWAFTIPAVILLAVFLVPSLSTSQRAVMDKPSKVNIAHKMQRIQIPFIANSGQLDEQVKFYANTFGGTVFVTKDGEIVYALPNNSSELGSRGSENQEARCMIQDTRNMSNITNRLSCILHHDSNIPYCNNCLLSNLSYNDRQDIQGVAIKETLVGGRVQEITGNEKAVTKVSYFKGNDTSQWKSNISTYDVVSLGEVYDGIELKLKAYGNNVEKLFCIKPDANPDQIQVKLSGAKDLRVNDEGQLEAETELGAVKFTKPIAYQEIDGKRVGVAVEYQISECGVRNVEITHPLVPSREGTKSEIQNLSSNQTCPQLREGIGETKLEYSFKVASYDKTKDLIIDPLLASTYLGGSGYDYGYSLALDTSGNVYVTGITYSSNFPTTSGAYDTSFNGGYFYNDHRDVFVSKLDSGLTSLLASTYLGGSDRDEGFSLALDTSGNVYVTGITYSSNFPTTSGAYNTSYNGGSFDVFVSKLDSGLTSLLASTYLGGSDYDYGYSLALDTSGNVYVTGITYSSNFPTTSGAYNTSYNGGSFDVFVSKLDSGLTSLLASTYLGGSGGDYSHSLTLDTSGNVYVTGDTQSSDFPTTSGAYDTSFNGGYPTHDVFVSKLDGELTSLLASTYLGGSGDDDCYSLALDTIGNVYVTGDTDSSDFPTTSGAYDTSFNGSPGVPDVFVSKLNSGLTSLLASTYLGGSGDDDYGQSLALDTIGNVYVTGSTGSTDFPTTSGAYDTSYNNGLNVFISKLNSGLTSLLASTYLGGDLYNKGYFLALDTIGNVYVMGTTGSPDFPTTSGAYDTSYNGSSNGSYDVFVSKLDGGLSAPDTTPPTVSSTNPSQNATEVDVNATITATFNEDIDSSSITTSTFNVSTGGSNISGTVSYSNKVATFTPSSSLSYFTTYTATVTTGAKDLQGNAMSSDYTWSFTTGAQPNTVPVANAGADQSAHVNDPVTLDGSGSADANGDTLTYQWTLSSVPTGSSASIADPDAKITSFVPDVAGTYVVQLVVNDGTVDSNPVTIQIQATDSGTAAIIAVQNSQTIIASLDPKVFKNANMQNTFINKLNAVIANIEAGNYADALDQLQNDILKKTDGCATAGAPDKNDWIKNCDAQGSVYPCILHSIEMVEALM